MSTEPKETKVSKTNRKPRILEPTVAPAPKVVDQVQRDEKGRIKVVAMSMVEWDDIIKAKNLKTASAMIRYLHGEGYAPSGIAKFLGKIYQHVRNVLNQPLKRPAAPTVEAVKPTTGDDSANDE